MKTIKIFSIIMLFFAVNVSAQQISTADLQVTGLTCSMCSNATQKSLETLSFVNTVKPDLNKNIFVLTFKKGTDINIDLIRKKVQDAGFSVGGLTANFNFNQVKIDEKGQAIVNGNVYRFVNAKNKTLNGLVKASVVDKNFISNSAFKKQAANIASDAYASGMGVVNGKKTRVYHLILS
ncbi:heavy-metal-associated domain-containing protein [Pedobacter endophyticus]|uniref:Heavy-metal-associated domain-containing protein n=1 Tax=Pedobacter endophyticus TaxID=2789740 RepID=A0A7U3Q5G3_9SPHI|nr:heavy-metal-associated domain-containing protein [Pedobacter endophyticus]QPH38030.1 heavy-metal-associated domain-containing protein [Pedobacter endophyticus]